MRRFMQQTRQGLALVGFWFLVTACVTVNIYFPAAAAEKAADRIIQDVWDIRPGEDQEPSAPPQNGWLETWPERRLALQERVLNILLPSAQAQQANIDISTPAINRIKREMESRHQHLKPYYDDGALGLTQDGLLTLRDLSAVPLPDRNKVRQLVAEENRDRNALYREIAVANNRPEWEDEIRNTFARRWIANARPGWWYQDSAGNWRQK